MRRFLFPPAVLCLLSAGCGYVGDPLPPLANIPAAVTDLTAVQRGSSIIVHFTAPTRTTEGVLIHTSLEYDLRAGTAPGQPFQPDVWAEQAQRIRGVAVEQGLATCRFSSAPFAGQNVTVAVRATGVSGKTSEWSNFLNLAVVAAPEVPAGLHADSAPQGVRLAWKGPPGDFRVFRQGADEPASAPLAEVHATEYTDATAEYGKRYVYSVERFVKLPSGGEAESDPSPAVSITPVDTFPPAAPSGLRAVPAPGSIGLSWDRNPEPDLAGYRVYRAATGGAFVKLAEVSQIPSYSDRAVEPAKSYRYAVAAFDRAGNESARSAPVEAAAQ